MRLRWLVGVENLLKFTLGVAIISWLLRRLEGHVQGRPPAAGVAINTATGRKWVEHIDAAAILEAEATAGESERLYANWKMRKEVYDRALKLLAAQAFKALGADVTGYSRSGTGRADFDRVLALDSFAAGRSPDVFILALPATADTDGLIDASMLQALDGALLINVGRGSTLDHAALRAALGAGHVSHAVLDVFEAEPLPRDDWRWAHPHVTVTQGNIQAVKKELARSKRGT